MKTVWSSIALACLVAGADAFGVMPEPGHPEPGHPTCEHGHTGDLAVLAAIGGSCAMLVPGHDDDPSTFDCELQDGSDNNYGIGSGAFITFKDVCPETCGAPCGHAPTKDHDAVAGGFNSTNAIEGVGPYPGAGDCKALADAGACADELLVNWFCGESCRGGAPWDECMWEQTAQQTAQEQIEADCADPAWLLKYDYLDVDACLDDSMANWLGDPSTGTCPGDPSGSECYYDTSLADYGSTEVHNCPGSRRRKLTRSGTHSGAMNTKGKFALTASGSK